MATIPDTYEIRLQIARHHAGLSQVSVAVKLGVTSATVSRWEHGERGLSPRILKEMAELYGVTVGWLMGEAPIFTDPE